MVCILGRYPLHPDALTQADGVNLGLAGFDDCRNSYA